TVLSETALHAIAKEITEAFGKNYLFTRQYATKNSNAQEAHEAIRPTYIERKTVTDDRDMQRLYELIWKRTIASQMADAELERTIVNIGISTTPEQLIAEGEVLKFDGFLKVYLESKDDDEEVETKGMLPPLRIGQSLQLDEMKAVEKFTRTAARYTEASLVKRLEELGIGRPSTYAPIISKIMEEGRGYVIKESKEGVERSYKVLILKDDVIKYEVGFEKTGAAKQVLSPTDMGMIVCDFLVQYFKEVMDYSFTANVEKEFDEIAIGNHRWNEMIGKFYTPFHNTIEKTALEADRATGERVIGKDPESGRTVLVRMSRFGPVAQIGSQEELAKDEKPKYANLKQSQSIESISLEDALDLFKLPKYIGDYLDNEVTIGLGRFGPYVKFQEQFYSIPRGVDPLALELEDAIVLIEEKKSADAPIGQFKGQPITKGKGRFGPFIKWGDLYANVSKKYNFDNLTEKDSIEILEEKIKKESNRYIRQWEAEKISIENGRWGPFIRFGKNMIKLPKLDDGQKHTSETAMTITLDEVKKAIEAEIPDAFAPKVSKAKKK
ncbi:MAG: DNA topoisomerase I, partial [Saprospiraceae bacterium]|nr:DNA topoisomerase I [Saprospiraceae bacterium]